MTDAKQRLAALSEEQRQLLARRLSQGRGQRAAHSIPRSSRRLETYPLSFAQQRMWFLNQVAELNTAFNVGEQHRLKGPLNVAALTLALNEIVRRHEVLRTQFETVNGQPVQRILPALTIDLPVEDLRTLSESDRGAALARRMGEESRRPWALDAGPVIRATLWRLADDDHVILILLHHIVADGWSKKILVDELTSLYRAFAAGQPSPLAELPIQYADFAVWQQEWVTGEEFTRQISYWKTQLKDLPTMPLPGNGSKQDSASSGLHRVVALSRDLSRDVMALSRQEGATLFMTLLAAFSVLLARYSGQNDVVVGSPVANRNRPEVEGLLGCFMNPLPMRVKFDAQLTFRQLLKQSRDVALGAYSNQDVPFDVLVRTLQPSRASARDPLFQVMLLLHNFSWQSMDLAREQIGTRAYSFGDNPIAGGSEFEFAGDLVYPAALEVSEIEGQIVCCFEYTRGLAYVLSRAAGHMKTLLQAVVANPDRPLASISMLTPAEETALMSELSGRQAAGTSALVTAVERFEAITAAAPNACAVVFGGERLTYAELNERANRLARHLRGAGVGPETAVGVMLPRSLDTAVALMAVLKAGGAYVPMDPNYPADRLAYLLDDAGARVLITNAALIEQSSDFASRTLPPLVCLDRDREVIAAHDGANLPANASPENLAYIIYTSGSTGRPKGTMVAHANLSAAYAAWEQMYGLRESARVHLQMASVSFDVFTGDFVRALCSGGTLVLVPHDLLFAPDRLLALMRDERVDSAEFVPAVMRDLLKHLDATGQRIDFMRLLVVGSDSWFANEYAEIRRFCGPSTRLINSYGVTEATIDSTFYESAALEMAADAQVPIGRPFPGVELYLLDPSMRPAPIGAPAELYIGGTGVTRGYLRRADLTAERFVPHPFSSEPGARLYRTGDLARFLPGGQLSLLGRADQQVKLRGFRIELAEVEAALAERPEVAVAAAAIKGDPSGDRRLYAYVVAAPDAECSAVELRRFLRERMPEHMVPSAIVVLDTLPLTPNGKIDRAALPMPDASRQTDDAFVPPSTELEQKIASVWQEVLGVTKVGIHDSFFDLGGHSLLLLRLQSRLRQTLDHTLSVLDLFKYPTVHTLAVYVAGQGDADARAASEVKDRVEKQREAMRRQRQARAPRAVTT